MKRYRPNPNKPRQLTPAEARRLDALPIDGRRRNSSPPVTFQADRAEEEYSTAHRIEASLRYKNAELHT